MKFWDGGGSIKMQIVIGELPKLSGAFAKAGPSSKDSVKLPSMVPLSLDLIHANALIPPFAI